jgi:hypothetical protein
MSRNPLDACVSSYYHHFNPWKCGWPFAAWVAVWLSGNTSYASWFDWVKEWHSQARQQQEQERVLWLQYEDVKRDPAAAVSRLSSFLHLSRDAAALAEVVRLSSFESMKQQATQRGDAETSERAAHLRGGESGSWRSHFREAPELVQQFKDAFDDKLRGTGLPYSLGAGEDGQVNVWTA